MIKNPVSKLHLNIYIWLSFCPRVSRLLTRTVAFQHSHRSLVDMYAAQGRPVFSNCVGEGLPNPARFIHAPPHAAIQARSTFKMMLPASTCIGSFERVVGLLLYIYT